MAKPVVKEWLDIVSPKYFGNRIIGQSTSADPQKFVGRIIETSLVELTGEATKYYIKLYFKADKVEGGKIYTKFSGHDTTRDFVARIVRLRSDRIDSNDIIELKDGKMRIKSIAVTARKVKKGLEKDIRKSIRAMTKEELNKMSVDDFLKNIVTGSLQKKIKKEVSKKYPLAQFEFRKSQILN